MWSKASFQIPAFEHFFISLPLVSFLISLVFFSLFYFLFVCFPDTISSRFSFFPFPCSRWSRTGEPFFKPWLCRLICDSLEPFLFPFDSSFSYFFSFHFSPCLIWMLDILSSLVVVALPSSFLFSFLYVNIPSPPSFSLVSRPLEASSDQTGNGHGEMTGYTELSCLFSCVMPRSLGYSQTEFNYRVSERLAFVVNTANIAHM